MSMVKAAVAIAGAIIGFIVIRAVGLWVAANWLAIVITLGTIGAIVLGVYLYRRHVNALLRAEYAELERHAAQADKMDVPQFEAWIGKMLIRDGFRKVRFVGRKADFGSDFVATSPDSRRVVIRAKQDDGTVSRRGSRHIQALGAERHARFKAETAMLVTNANLHRSQRGPKHEALADQLGVILIDRLELGAWASDRPSPKELTSAHPQ